MSAIRPVLVSGLCSVLFAMALPFHVHAAAPITAVAIAPDGQQVLIGSQRGIEVRTYPDMTAVATLPTDLLHVHDLRFAPNGQHWLAAGGSPAESGDVEIWSWPEGQRLSRVSAHSDVVYRVAWSPDGSRWASCGGDARCCVFSTNGEELARYDGHSQAVCSLRWLDDQTVASVGMDQTVRLWKAETGEPLRTLDNHVGGVNDLATRPVTTDSDAGPRKDILATASEDRTVRLWQPRVGRLMRFARLTSVPRIVAWSADAKRLIVGCNDGQVRIIDWESMELVAEVDGGVGRIHELLPDPAGEFLLVAGETGVRRFAAPVGSN